MLRCALPVLLLLHASDAKKASYANKDMHLWSYSMKHNYKKNHLQTHRSTGVAGLSPPPSPPSFSVNQTSVKSGDDFVSVSFAVDRASDRAGCWFGVFDAAANVTVSTSKTKYDGDMPFTDPMPVKYILCPKADRNFLETGNGAARVRLLNMRKDLKLWLCLGGIHKPTNCVATETVTVENKNQPMHRHITRLQNVNEMLVQWTCLEDKDRKVIHTHTNKVIYTYTHKDNHSETYDSLVLQFF